MKNHKKRNFALASTGLLIGLTLVLVALPHHTKPGATAPTQNPTPPTLNAVPADTEVSRHPRQLRIPKLHIDAPIIPLGVNAAGEFAAPASGQDVGWYTGSARPDPDNPNQAILLDGHVVDRHGNDAVFAALHTLQKGDELSIRRGDNRTFDYVVSSVAELPVAQVDMAALITPATGTESVSIITCAGDFNTAQRTYTHRTIVQAVKKQPHESQQ